MNKLKGMIRGVGINDADYSVFSRGSNRVSCPMYSRWKGLIERCYGDNEKYKARYGDCGVDARWHSFMTFRSWMLGQPWQGNHLDKDILSPGMKLYRPETSVFVPPWLNALMADHGGRCDSLSPGVSFDSRNKKLRFQARINDNQGRRVCIGSYETDQEAHAAWRKAKAIVLSDAEARYRQTERFDERVAVAISARADSYRLAGNA
jgi:hypothetical protein